MLSYNHESQAFYDVTQVQRRSSEELRETVLRCGSTWFCVYFGGNVAGVYLMEILTSSCLSFAMVKIMMN